MPHRFPDSTLSVFVVVAVVGDVPVPVVYVVQVVAVQNGGVAASLAVHVDVLLGRYVRLGRTFVIVIVVPPVDVLVVEVVDVVVVAYLDVSAALTMCVVVGFGGHVVCNGALVVVPVVGVVQVSIVEIVDVADMFHRAMPAGRPVDMAVLFVDWVGGHRHQSDPLASYPASPRADRPPPVGDRIPA
jgi:hypothetical protein